MESGDRVRVTHAGLNLPLLQNASPNLEGVVDQTAAEFGIVQVLIDGENQARWWPMMAWEIAAESDAGASHRTDAGARTASMHQPRQAGSQV
jgi:hypothetical protein